MALSEEWDGPLAAKLIDAVNGDADAPEDREWASTALKHWSEKDTTTSVALHTEVAPMPIRKPNKKRGTAPLLKLIRRAEANGRYDAFYSFDLPSHRQIDEMTVNEVLAYQDGYDARPGATSTAAGAYQIIQPTLRGLVASMHLDGSERFNAAMQDRMATKLLIGRRLDTWLQGGDWRRFAHNLSKEWASLPNVIGIGRGGKAEDPEASYYDGHAGNKAHVTISEMKEVLA